MTKAAGLPQLTPQDLGDDTVALVQRWLAEADDPANAGKRDRSAEWLAGLLKDADGLSFTIGFVDQVVRPSDLKVAARNLERLSRQVPKFLPLYLRLLIQLGGGFAPLLPWIVVPIARRVFRATVSHLVLDASPKRLDKKLAALRGRGNQLNINLLGEAVLGLEEADRRLAKTREILARDDVDYVSIKISALSGKLGMWAYEQTVDRVVERLTPLYEQAANAPGTKFINLDMEEFHDLDLTIDVFKKLLDKPALRNLDAGIVLQAYLPDALGALQGLTEWATRRRLDGGAGIKVRVVKGANLPMEQIDAVQHGWPLATVGSKQEADTNYKRVLNWAMTPERTDAVRLGVAGHNLFDIAFAWLLAEQRGVTSRVEFEMLLGMAAVQADVVKKTVGGLLLYTPVVRPHEFNAAIAYLIRRLEENASQDNFMSAVFELSTNKKLFKREEERFRASLEQVDEVVPESNRQQNRLNVKTDTANSPKDGDFAHAQDTDASIAENRRWADQLLERARTSTLGEATLQASTVADAEQLQGIITSTAQAGEKWGATGINARAQLVHEVGDVLAAYRGRIIEVLVSETGKTIAEADAEASETIDLAHYYAKRTLELDSVDSAQFEPSRLTVVVPPFSGAVAGAAGSALAAIGAGSAVILKPSERAPRSSALVAEALWEAGVPVELAVVVTLGAPELLEKLLAEPRVDQVIFTGSRQAAERYNAIRGGLPLLAETGGRNAIIVTPNADVDLAVGHIVSSAFAHAGQHRMAASLVILVGSVAKSEQLTRQLTDAVTSMKAGPADDATTSIGPLIEPAAGAILKALTVLDEGESWLIEPKRLDDEGTLFTAGVKLGVTPGSRTHLDGANAPVLGIMVARTLDKAIELQNAGNSGLAAGIHSLDADEIDTWLAGVQAGNLSVNRSTTETMVERHPVGGWCRSSIGPGAKTGGPNYLRMLGEWKPVFADASSSVKVSGIGEAVLKVIEAAQPSLEFLEFDRIRAGAVSDQNAWESVYSLSTDPAGLISERNVLRYRPVPVTVRLAEGESIAQLVRVIAAAARVGAPVAISSAAPMPTGLISLFDREQSSGGSVRIESVLIESDVRWNARVRGGLDATRIRMIGSTEAQAALTAALDGSTEIIVYSGEVTTSGVLELWPFLREQTVSVTAHRHGNPDQQIAQISL